MEIIIIPKSQVNNFTSEPTQRSPSNKVLNWVNSVPGRAGRCLVCRSAPFEQQSILSRPDTGNLPGKGGQTGKGNALWDVCLGTSENMRCPSNSVKSFTKKCDHWLIFLKRNSNEQVSVKINSKEEFDLRFLPGPNINTKVTKWYNFNLSTWQEKEEEKQEKD